jgi:hypothetical protein
MHNSSNPNIKNVVFLIKRKLNVTLTIQSTPKKNLNAVLVQLVIQTHNKPSFFGAFRV